MEVVQEITIMVTMIDSIIITKEIIMEIIEIMVIIETMGITEEITKTTEEITTKMLPTIGTTIVITIATKV